MDALAPWSHLVAPEQLQHLIVSVTESVVAHLVDQVPAPFQSILHATLSLDPKRRKSIDKLVVGTRILMQILVCHSPFMSCSKCARHSWKAKVTPTTRPQRRWRT